MRIYDIIPRFFLELTGKHSRSLAVVPVIQHHLLETVHGNDTYPVSTMPIERVIFAKSHTGLLSVCHPDRENPEVFLCLRWLVFLYFVFLAC